MPTREKGTRHTLHAFALLGFVVVLVLAGTPGCYTQIAPSLTIPPPVAESPPDRITEEQEADGDGIVTRSIGPLGFTLSVQPTRFRAGDPVVIEITLDNSSPTFPYERTFPSGCNVAFEVRDEGGRLIGPYRVCDNYGSEIVLAPAERRIYRYEYYGGEQGYFGGEGELEPGRYWVTAGFVSGSSLMPTVPPVAIELLP
ncbi:MAG: hypothetical protein ACE15D_13965 [Candidatus Eisenbacteria bacterium]